MSIHPSKSFLFPKTPNVRVPTKKEINSREREVRVRIVIVKLYVALNRLRTLNAEEQPTYLFIGGGFVVGMRGVYTSH